MKKDKTTYHAVGEVLERKSFVTKCQREGEVVSLLDHRGYTTNPDVGSFRECEEKVTLFSYQFYLYDEDGEVLAYYMAEPMYRDPETKAFRYGVMFMHEDGWRGSELMPSVYESFGTVQDMINQYKPE